MKLRRTWELSKKSLKELRRNRSRLFFTIAFPIVFLLIFGTVFGQQQSTSYSVGIANMGNTTLDGQYTRQLIGNLTNTGIIQVKDYGNNSASAQEALKEGQLSGVLVLPSDFGQSVESFWMSPTNSSRWTNASLLLYVDSGNMFASQAILPLVQQALAKAVLGSHVGVSALPVNVSSPTLVSVNSMSYIDSLAPGMMIFAVLMTLSSTETIILEEKEKGLTRRIRTTPTTVSDIMIGVTITALVVTVIQVAIMFGASSALLGYNPQGGAYGLITGFLVAMVFAVSMVGIGLIISAVSKNDSSASVATFVIQMPLMFFSGLFFPRQSLPAAVQPISNILPTTYASDALTSLLSRGAAITSSTVVMDILGISIFTIVVYAIGMLLFRRSSTLF